MTFLAVWARVIGAAAARRALPVWTGVAILSAILFGGTAMPPSALTHATLGSWRFGAGFAATWLVLVVPAGRAMLDPAATAYLRALPAGRAGRAAVTWAIACAVQMPWTVLWATGEGALAAVAATIASAAAMLAIAEAAERLVWPHRTPRWRGPIAALVGAHRRMLLRGRSAALVRAAGVAWLGGAAAGLVARSNQLAADEATWWGLAVASAGLPIACGALAGPIVDGDRKMAWLLVASGCRWPSRVLAASLVMAGLGAGLGVVFATGCWGIGELPLATAATLAGWLALLGAGIGGLALRAGAWAAAHDDGDRTVIAMVGVAVAAFVAIGVLGPVGAAAVAAAGAAAAAGAREAAA